MASSIGFTDRPQSNFICEKSLPSCAEYSTNSARSSVLASWPPALHVWPISWMPPEFANAAFVPKA